MFTSTRRVLSRNLWIMLLLSWPLTDVASGEAFSVVAPSGMRGEEGNARGNGPVEPIRVQSLYSSSFFDSLQGVHDVLSIAWRPDETTGEITTQSESITIRLSTTALEELSLEFAENTGSDETLVYDGPITISTAGLQMPRGFDFGTEFTTPFRYDPSQGNLLIDFTTSGFDEADWWTDNESFDDGTQLLVQTFQGGDPAAEIADGGFNALAVMEFTFASSLPGDFDRDGMLGELDIDLLTAEVLNGTNDSAFDLNEDQLVDAADRTVWIKELKDTWIGDANLDREFNSGDLVAVFEAGQYEDGVPLNSGWATGDWDGDGEFGSGDLVLAFQHGGYEQGPRATVDAVPEPTSFLMLMAGLIGIAIRQRHVCT